MFVNFASAEAASSASRFVVSPNITIVFTKPSKSSAETPNCPAASATAAISAFELVVSVDICIIALAISS